MADYQKYEYLFSSKRMQRYLAASGSDRHAALSLYSADIALAKALIPLLHLFEIGLRNALNRAVAAKLQDTNWLLSKFSSTSSDLNLYPLASNKQLKAFFIDNPITNTSHDKVVSSMTLGFWVGLLGSSYWKSFKGAQVNAFPNAKRNQRRRTHLQGMLESIRVLRNRVGHWEPICFGQNGSSMIDLTTTEQTCDYIKKLAFTSTLTFTISLFCMMKRKPHSKR
jgi:hypothetical protein